MPYQDIWIKGRLVKKGYRECAIRYQLIKSFCTNFNRPFTVCDIGSNMNYFGVRLTEDFPEAKIIAFEYNQFDLRMEHLKQNDARRVFLYKVKINLENLKLLAKQYHFDLVLALSVLHHVKESTTKWLEILTEIGDNVIIEFAVEDSPRVRTRDDYHVPPNGILLGYAPSHKVKGILRPIILMKKNVNK